jgi:hypothetical protein
MPSSSPVRWQPRDEVDIPASASTPTAIATLARQLTPRQQEQVVKAFEDGSYELGTNFVWQRTMAGLKNRLGSLGIEFIAELLDRPDIRPHAEAHEVLTDYEAVRLAEELGMFGSTQAMRLRHSLDLVAHFANPPDDATGDEMTREEAMSALRICVQTILGHEELGVAVEFAEFRRRLETTILDDDAPEIDDLVASAYFFRRTVLRMLVASSKTASGAQLENVLANANILIPPIWPSLKDPDRYLVGRAYADVHADGQSTAAAGLRSALLKVAGFDYVPEGLRSRAFLEAAARVQAAHFEWDNFHNEPAPMRAIASLGTSIPLPAFHRCMTAIILVRIGNPYGVSIAAQPSAFRMLKDVTAERWKYFFDDCLPVDDVLLGELRNAKIAGRWCEMVAEFSRLEDVTPTNRASKTLLAVARDNDARGVMRRAQTMLGALSASR